MANMDKILKSVLQVAQVLTPLLPQLGAASAVASALGQLITDVKAAAGGQNQATLDQLTALQAQVNAHTDAVLDRLGDAPGG